MRVTTRLSLSLTLLCLAACRCDAPAPQADAPVPEQVEVTVERYVATGDLDAIKAKGVLRALVQESDEGLHADPRSATAQRDRVEAFARRHGLKAEFIRIDDFGDLIPALVEGRGDVIADDLTVTESRSQRVDFTRPIATASELVVGRRGADNPRSVEALEGLTVQVLGSTSFHETLQALKQEKLPSLVIDAVTEHVEPESLVYDVSQGKRPLTVIDSHTMKLIETYNEDVEALFPIAEGRQIAWAVRKNNPTLKAALDAFIIEQALTGHRDDTSTGDLDAMKKRGSIRFLTRNNAVTYFLHRGRRVGFDYELATMVGKALGLRVEMVVVPSRDQLVPWLLEGRGDVIAASFSVTDERKKKIAFTRPYLWVDELVVQRTDGPKVASLEDLRGRKIHVRRSSSYHDTLVRLQPEWGFEIVEAPETVETEELIGQVARAEIDFTVADSHIFQVEATYRDGIEAGFTLPRPEGADDEAPGARGIAFATRPGNPELMTFLDAFVKRTYRGLEYNIAKRKYFENERSIAATRAHVISGAGLSNYDDILRKYATQYSLDWRLVASQAYQESRFNPQAKSWVGALGLMQVMPATGREMGFNDLVSPDPGVHAGVLYLHKLVKRLDPMLDFKQRLRFALAGYNAGIGHVRDARRLAVKQGLDPNRWFGHVEKAMLLLEKPKYYSRAAHGYCRGSEPVKYVSEIQSRYDHYVELIPDR